MTASAEFRTQPLRRTARVVREYTEIVEPGLLLEDAMSLPYWHSMLPGLCVGDAVSLVAGDGSYDVTVRITHLDNDSIHFRLLREWRRPIEATAEDFAAFDADLAHLAASDYRHSDAWQAA